MKKTSAIFLILCMVFAVSSCKETGNGEHSEHTSQWAITKQGHSVIYTCGCESKDIMQLHIFDEENVCIICGYERTTDGVDYEYDTVYHWIPVEEGEPIYEGHQYQNDVCQGCGYVNKT